MRVSNSVLGWTAYICVAHNDRVCACKPGWEGAPDCSIEAPVDPFAVQCKDYPVLAVGEQVPSWLFGNVTVTANASASVKVGVVWVICGQGWTRV